MKIISTTMPMAGNQQQQEICFCNNVDKEKNGEEILQKK
jgi:hypothetical protein